MESNPFGVIPLLGDSSPYRGNIFSGIGGAREDGSSYRPILKKSRVVALMVLDNMY